MFQYKTALTLNLKLKFSLLDKLSVTQTQISILSEMFGSIRKTCLGPNNYSEHDCGCGLLVVMQDNK